MKPRQILDYAFLAFLIISLSAGCGEDRITGGGDDNGTGEPATLDKRVSGNNSFAMDLYFQLAFESEDDLVICPHSISTVFGMAYAGARGNTEKQIAGVLHFNYPQAGFHSIVNRLNRQLEERPGTELDIDNGCWVDSIYHYEKEYLDTVSLCYDAQVDSVDFSGHPEEARLEINDWVWNNCGIKDLFAEGAIDNLTYMVLVNTIVLKGKWLKQFDPAYSYDGDFHKLDGVRSTARFMHGESTMPYFEGDGFKALEMFFEEGKMSMVLILPDEGEFLTFESDFSKEAVDTITADLAPEYVVMTIPRFVIESSYSLKSTLMDMGMTDPFFPGADFSGMDGTDDGAPWISVVVHKAYIMINEYGAYASAASGMALTLGIHPEFVANRPFIYFIRDIETGTILFMGRVLDPVDPIYP